MANSVLGFEFGSNTLKIAKVSGKTVQSVANVVLPDNIVREGVIVSYDAMAEVIREAVKKNKLTGNAAAVILPSKYAILRRFEMPLMTEDQLSMNLPYEFHDFLDMDKDKYYYDYLVNFVNKEEAAAEGEEKKGPSMDLTAAAVPKEIVNEYKGMFKRAGLKLVTAIPAECAYGNLLNNLGADESREYCFINLGEEQSTVTVFKGAVYQTARVKDTGISAVAEQIADAVNCDIHMARERLASNFEGAQETDNAQTVYNAIAADIRKTINFYKFSNRESELGEAYVTGAGASIPLFREAISQTADLQLSSVGDILPPVSGWEGDAGIFALAIGCALQ